MGVTIVGYGGYISFRRGRGRAGSGERPALATWRLALATCTAFYISFFNSFSWAFRLLFSSSHISRNDVPAGEKFFFNSQLDLAKALEKAFEKFQFFLRAHDFQRHSAIISSIFTELLRASFL